MSYGNCSIVLGEGMNLRTIFSWTGNKKFKVATKLDERLKLTCPVVQQIVNVENQNLCADLAKGYEEANGLYYDETNTVCSIQHCNKNGITVTGVLNSRISIMFEDKFYPRSKCPQVFRTKSSMDE